MDEAGNVSPTLETLIIVSTVSATGLIILVIINAFLCCCILIMCQQQRRRAMTHQPQYQRCTPTNTLPNIRVRFQEVRFQDVDARFQNDDDEDYSEIPPRTEHLQTTTQLNFVRVPTQQFASSLQLGQVSQAQWVPQKSASIDNIYSSVIDSHEDLSGQIREARIVPVRREFRTEGQLGSSMLSQQYTPNYSPSRSVDMETTI